MENILLLFWALLLPFLFGLTLITILIGKDKDFSCWEKISLSFFIGTSVFTMLLFLMSILQIKWNSLGISLIFGLFSFGLLSKYYLKTFLNMIKKPLKSSFTFNFLTAALIFLIIFKFLMIFYLALDKPIMNWDAWSNWSLRAKVFYFEKGIPLDLKHPYFLGGGGHINYPLQLPILQAWIYTVLGSWNDQLVKIILPLYLLSFTIFLFSYLLKFMSKIKSLLFIFIFISLPFINYHASGEYMDLPVGLYVGMGTLLLFRFLPKRQLTCLLLSSLLLGFSGWIKNEGFMILCLTLVFLLIYFIRKKIFSKLNWGIILSALAGLIFLSPWIFYKSHLGLGMSNLETTNSLLPNLSFIHYQILPTLLQGISSTFNFGILWLAFILSLIFISKRVSIPYIQYLFVLIMIYFLAYLGIYLLTENYTLILNGTILQRNLLTLVPTIFWVMAILWGKYFDTC